MSAASPDRAPLPLYRSRKDLESISMEGGGYEAFLNNGHTTRFSFFVPLRESSSPLRSLHPHSYPHTAPSYSNPLLLYKPFSSWVHLFFPNNPRGLSDTWTSAYLSVYIQSVCLLSRPAGDLFIFPGELAFLLFLSSTLSYLVVATLENWRGGRRGSLLGRELEQRGVAIKWQSIFSVYCRSAALSPLCRFFNFYPMPPPGHFITSKQQKKNKTKKVRKEQ